jgi:hypothetical protein
MKNFVKRAAIYIFMSIFLCQTGFTALPKGNAAWVYDVNSTPTQKAMWSDWIGFYNGNTLAPHNITTLYSYGGDMGIYNGSLITSFPLGNQVAAKTYKTTTYGVKNVILTVDGQMNGGQSYSPDLSKLSVVQVQAWADSTAKLYCMYDFVDGLQIDLEPARSPYLANLLVFLKQLSADLMLSSNNCLNSSHPSGRSMGVFLGVGAATPQMFTTIGSNSYIILSGYDLSDAPLGSPATTPYQYGLQLTAALKLLSTNAGVSGHYVVGIPGAASVHEFSQYIPVNGSPVFGYPMYSQTQDNYTKQAIAAIKNTVYTHQNYLGTALWGFTLQMANPVNSKNMFYPSNPFQQAGQFNYYQGNL